MQQRNRYGLPTTKRPQQQLTKAQLLASPSYQLTALAWEIVCRNLTSFGNVLSGPHKDGLMEVVGWFTQLAYGQKKGRYAFPLDCGLGKTQSVVAWCAALHQLGRKDLSIAVAAFRVEQLCDIKRDLILNGVPAESIGLLHSLKDASEPCTPGGEGRQILLITHARVLGGDLELFNSYGGKARNVLIWDEALIVSESQSIERRFLQKSWGWINPDLTDGEPVWNYMAGALDTLAEEQERQRNGLSPTPIRLPPLTYQQVAAFRERLGNDLNVFPLHSLLDIQHQDLRAVGGSGGGGVITYNVAIPKELENIAVLDAGYPISLLQQLDVGITNAAKWCTGIKRYDNVTIHHMIANSGRMAVTKDFGTDRKVSAEVCKVVQQLPTDQGVILFTFKTRPASGKGKPVDFAGILKDDLEAAGVDTQATVTVLEKGEPVQRSRFVFRTWGQETGDSQFAYCKHVVFAGVLHRHPLELTGSSIGQRDDLMADTPSSLVEDLATSEIAHVLYQAMCRGCCRFVDGLQAHAMDVWLIHHQEGPALRTLLDKAMPGLKWTLWVGEHIGTPRDTKQAQLAETIRGYLLSLPEVVTKMSTNKLKEGAGITHHVAKTVTRALEDALDGLDGLWRTDGRSVVRYRVEDMFTEEE
jgi:hypothetical protein